MLLSLISSPSPAQNAPDSARLQQLTELLQQEAAAEKAAAVKLRQKIVGDAAAQKKQLQDCAALVQSFVQQMEAREKRLQAEKQVAERRAARDRREADAVRAGRDDLWDSPLDDPDLSASPLDDPDLSASPLDDPELRIFQPQLNEVEQAVVACQHLLDADAAAQAKKAKK